MPTSSRELIALLFLAAKRVWARLQRVARAPSIKDWFMKARNLEIVNQVPEGILIGELSGYESKFVERWF